MTQPFALKEDSILAFQFSVQSVVFELVEKVGSHCIDLYQYDTVYVVVKIIFL